MPGLGCSVAVAVVVLLVLVTGGSRGKGILGALGLLVSGVITLASAAFTALCVWVGMKAHWTSDGPGMLFVMLGVVFGAIVTFGFGSLFLSRLSGGPPPPRQ